MDKKTFIKQRRKNEIEKCKKDPIYFLRTYCIIQHPIKGKIPFNLYPFQEDTLKQLTDNRFNIILKSRQLGISTLTAGYTLWYMMWHQDKNILIFSINQRVSVNLLKKIQIMYNGIPNWMKNDILGTTPKEFNKTSMVLNNGSQTISYACTEDAGSSEAASMIILDEAAKINENILQHLWASIYPTLSTGGRAVLLSTPKGVGNFFHEQWVRAENGESNFNTIKLPWTVHPERDQSWRDDQDKDLGKIKAKQECECTFLVSDDTVIDGDTIQYYENNDNILQEDQILEYRKKKKFHIFKEPEENKNYMVVADVARGDATDFSGFHILDVETLEQVAEYKDKIGTTDYAKFLVLAAHEWNNALLIVENTGLGWSVLEKIIEIDYPNLYYSIKGNPHPDPNMYLRKGINLDDKDKMVPGFSTTSKSRPLLIDRLITLLEEKELIIHSKRLINEMNVFVWKNGKAQARSGYNDDLIMAYAIGLFVQSYALKIRQAGIDLTKATLGNFGKTKEKKEEFDNLMIINTSRARKTHIK
jgi:hypothetical protein